MTDERWAEAEVSASLLREFGCGSHSQLQEVWWDFSESSLGLWVFQVTITGDAATQTPLVQLLTVNQT